MNDKANEPAERSWLEKITQLFSAEPRNRNDLRELLRLAARNEVLDTDSLGIMEGALRVNDKQARDIMIPQPQMVAVRADAPLRDVLPEIIKAGHSRYPVTGESSDEVLGILLAKDLLPLLLNSSQANFTLRDKLRSAIFVPESKRLNVLLREFRQNRNHMAMVLNEYGGIAGLVTIEDVLEEIVGEIEDEYDSQNASFIQQLSANEFRINALTPLAEFNDRFRRAFGNDDFDTVGGMVMHHFGHVPKSNESIIVEGLRFQILSADNRRIHELRLTIPETDPG